MTDTYKDRPEPYQAARLRIRGGSIPNRRPTPPAGFRIEVVRIGEYTRDDWDAESYSIFGEGGNPAACPECGRTGFYGPRFAEPERRFRACRFCGFWQDVDGPPTRYLPTAHTCDPWPELSHAPYIWWVSSDTDAYDCPFCGDPVIVAVAVVPTPAETPKHPWWKIPQNRPPSFYRRLWSNWECSAGRTIL